MNKLLELTGDARVFEAKDSGDPNILKQCMASPKLTLKVGAQVMLIKNLSQHLVNGSLGIVTAFTKVGKTEYPVVKFSNGIEQAMGPEQWDFTIAGKNNYRWSWTSIKLFCRQNGCNSATNTTAFVLGDVNPQSPG